MAQSLNFQRCPLCGEKLPEKSNGRTDLPDHLSDCPKREPTLARLEKEAKRVRARQKERRRRFL